MSEVNVYTLKTVRLNLLWSITYDWPVSPEHAAHCHGQANIEDW